MSLPRRPFLTTRAHEVFALAHDLADRLGHDDLTPVHVALSVLREGRGVAVARHGVGFDEARAEVLRIYNAPA